MNPTVTENMPEEEYFAIDRMSKSTLWPFSYSTKNGAAMLEEPFTGNASTVLGSGFHRLVEDEGWDNIIEHTATKTSDTKAFKQQEQENPDKTVILAKDAKRLRKMWESMKAHPKVSKVISESSKAELVLQWDDDILQLPMKCRIDRVFPGIGGVDVKTVAECTVRKIENNIKDYGYHAQAALYCRAMMVCMDIKDPAWLFSWHETGKPYDCIVSGVPVEDIAQGWDELKRAAARYRKWKETGLAPGISEVALTLGLPQYAKVERLTAVHTIADVYK